MFWEIKPDTYIKLDDITSFRLSPEADVDSYFSRVIFISFLGRNERDYAFPTVRDCHRAFEHLQNLLTQKGEKFYD